MVMEFASFRDIIDLWSSRKAMAADVERARRGRATAHVRIWRHRDAIPRRWFGAVVRAAERRGFGGVTHAVLTDLHQQRKTDG